MPRDQQRTYIKRLGELGYCWQFITLAGLHTTALISNTFAKAYAKRGMAAYGELVQEPEMANGIDVVTHRKWSGANYVDSMLKMVTYRKVTCRLSNTFLDVNMQSQTPKTRGALIIISARMKSYYTPPRPRRPRLIKES